MVGRRDRNKQLKQERIFAAASELFAQEPYEQVTVQRIADQADVGVGTLFRYAATKAELLLMVLNERLAAAVDRGQASLDAQPDAAPIDRARAYLAPILSWAHEQGGNVLRYQEEVLFGRPDDQYRAIAIALGERIEAGLATAIGGPRAALSSPHLTAARMLYSAIVLEVAKAELLGEPYDALTAQIFDQVDIAIRGASPVA